MMTLLWIALFLVATLGCAFVRAPLIAWTAINAGLLAALTASGGAGPIGLSVLWLVFALIAVPLNVPGLRRRLLSAPMLKFYRSVLPRLSDTERTALDAGTVGWEGELFAGRPRWRKLLGQPAPALSDEERAFLEGPVEELCAMIDEWEINHELADMPAEMWQFLKDQRFFSMIIPKHYGGLEFSAYAQHRVLARIASRSWVVASTVGVPNSLGPGELLMKYGTDAQKDHYLPRLSRGEEIPCFGLTGPTAGSDATSIPDTGVVCHGTWKGKKVLGMRMNFDKRYITLAPVATVIGIAFRLKDPDGLLGEKEDLGITLALLPHDVRGLEVGKRHMPLNLPFQNGPVRGKDVFVPLDQIIGGPKMAGEGWRMLVECLSVGRAITLPSNSAGGMAMGAAATGAYARIRRQFNLPIGRFEGVQEALARIGGYTYATTALSRATAAAVDQGEKPSVPSAIAKYHATEMGRSMAGDAMDVHGGKGVILGPRNYLGRSWQGAPISITVEGANILTRNMIIFGQGAIRCHPFVLKEMEAAAMEDAEAGLKAFDKALFGHIGLTLSNGVRALLLAFTGGRLAAAPAGRATARHYRRVARFSAGLGLAADLAMLTLGGKLKFKERLSARLGDVLSHLYIVSSMLKRFEDQGRPDSDLVLLNWACDDAFHKIEQAFDGIFRNLPNRPVAWMLRAVILPLGRRARKPDDYADRKVAEVLMTPSATRERLTELAFLSQRPENVVGMMEATLRKVIQVEPAEKALAQARRSGALAADADLEDAVKAGVISAEQVKLMEELRAEVAEIIAVDEFNSEDLAAGKSRGGKRASRIAA